MRREQISTLRDGALSAASLLVGIVPWGIVTGVAMVSAGLTPVEAVAMGVLVFAGSAQLAVLPLLNLEHLSRPWRAVLSYITVDGVFALFVGRFRPDDGDPHKHWFFLGGSLAMWGAWQLSSWVGIFGGALIPKEWMLEFAATLGLIALLIPLLFDRAVTWGAIAAGGVALIAAKLPLNLGLLAAIAAGIAVGLAVARFGSPKAGSG